MGVSDAQLLQISPHSGGAQPDPSRQSRDSETVCASVTPRSPRFDDPIPGVRTLRHAVSYIQGLPRAQQQLLNSTGCAAT